MNHYVLIMIIMVGMGIMGGVINFFILALDESSKIYFLFKNIFTGLGASALVPVFLQTVSSDLLSNGLITMQQYFLFAGICLSAALTSRIFIRTFPKAVIQKITALEKVFQSVERIEKIQPPPSNLTDKNKGKTSESTGLEERQVDNRSEELSAEAIRTMAVLKQPNYIFMTLEELAAKVEFKSDHLSIILDQLQEKGYVTSIQREQETLWGLTYKGYNYSI